MILVSSDRRLVPSTNFTNSYFLICLGDSNWGGEQGPKWAQDIVMRIGAKSDNPTQCQYLASLDTANPLKYYWQMRTKLFKVKTSNCNYWKIQYLFCNCTRSLSQKRTHKDLVTQQYNRSNESIIFFSIQTMLPADRQMMWKSKRNLLPQSQPPCTYIIYYFRMTIVFWWFIWI